MDIKFDVYWRDEKTGSIEIKNNVLVKKVALTDDIFKFPFCNDNDGFSILGYLTTRVVPPDRGDIDHLLKLMGLEEYNAFDILKITKGMDPDDFNWFKFEGDEHLTFKDIHPRGRKT